ncbi:MAG: nucleotidyltransferase domain-containing protein [Candidatus Krumholzibacteriia bacterium]
MATVGVPADADLVEFVVDALSGVGIDGVEAVYVFGSVAEARVRDDSDVDLAFLTARARDRVAVFDAAQALAQRLGREVDLIDLRRASTVMKLQVLDKGRRIYTRDVVSADTFEMYAYSDYARLQEERAPTLRAFESLYDD